MWSMDDGWGRSGGRTGRWVVDEWILDGLRKGAWMSDGGGEDGCINGIMDVGQMSGWIR